MPHKHEAYENEKEYWFQQSNQLKFKAKGPATGTSFVPGKLPL
jgi:hypothetical protein